MIVKWLRKSLAARDSRRLVRTVRSLLKKKRDLMAPREAEHAEARVLACEEALKKGSLHEMRTSRKALRLFFDNNLKSYDKSAVRKNVEAVAVAVVLALAVRAFVVQPFKIPSGSMLPTLLVGDHILINKFLYGTRIPFTNFVFFPFSEIERGDVVVFKLDEDASSDRSLSPAGGVFYIKRAVGVAGDEIDMSGRNVLINGRPVSQVYSGDYAGERANGFSASDRYEQTLSGKKFSVIYRKGQNSTTRGNSDFPLVVPEGGIFVMGDNRDNSYDSRFWGFVPVESVYGKAFVIHWSWNLSDPELWEKIRWKRIFSPIE